MSLNINVLYRKVSFDTIESTSQPISINEQATLTQELTASRYVSPKQVSDYMTTVRSVYSWKTPYFQLDFWIPDTHRTKWQYPLNKLLRRLETLRLHYDSTKSIHFVCVPLDIPRHFPKNPTQCLGREHVNGGYTYVNGNTVYLFRREELPKVMLHEYLHQIQGHKDAEWTPDSLETIRALVPIPSGIDIRPNEAVIEAWALFYHTHFISIETGIPFKTLWDAESKFVLHQAQNVWSHQTKCLPYWNEQTHTFSYYILKALFVWSWQDATASTWRLNYSIEELTHWVQSHWDAWKQKIDIQQTKTPKSLSARMTRFGDF